MIKDSKYYDEKIRDVKSHLKSSPNDLFWLTVLAKYESEKRELEKQ